MKKYLILCLGALLFGLSSVQSTASAQAIMVSVEGILDIQGDNVFLQGEPLLFGRSTAELQNTQAEYDYNKDGQIGTIWDELKGFNNQIIVVAGMPNGAPGGGVYVAMINGTSYEKPYLKDKVF